MRKLVSILLLSLILMQSFSKVWVFISFKINQEYIARVLCINRDKPEMRCCGKCVLMKRIKAEEEQEKKQLPQRFKDQNEAVYCIDLPKGPFFPPTLPSDSRKPAFFYRNSTSTAFVPGVFRPPAL